MTKQQHTSKLMSVCIEHSKNEKSLPITYSINIRKSSTFKQPVTCCITGDSKISKRYTTTVLNSLETPEYLEKLQDIPKRSSENEHLSSIYLPITYSSSIYVPYRPPIIASHAPINLPLRPGLHHYHYYHYHYYYLNQQAGLSSEPSAVIDNEISSRPISYDSTRSHTISTISTKASPVSLIVTDKLDEKVPLSTPMPPRVFLKNTSFLNSHCPSYATLVWNWLRHIPRKTENFHNYEGQSDYSEICHDESPNKRNRLSKLLISSKEKNSKSKHHRTCCRRKRNES